MLLWIFMDWKNIFRSFWELHFVTFDVDCSTSGAYIFSLFKTTWLRKVIGNCICTDLFYCTWLIFAGLWGWKVNIIIIMLPGWACRCTNQTKQGCKLAHTAEVSTWACSRSMLRTGQSSFKQICGDELVIGGAIDIYNCFFFFNPNWFFSCAELR